jgi:hypothetical protein
LKTSWFVGEGWAADGTSSVDSQEQCGLWKLDLLDGESIRRVGSAGCQLVPTCKEGALFPGWPSDVSVFHVA